MIKKCIIIGILFVLTASIVIANDPPSKPIINGPTKGEPGKSYTYYSFSFMTSNDFYSHFTQHSMPSFSIFVSIISILFLIFIKRRKKWI